jgi:hypothetical protein
MSVRALLVRGEPTEIAEGRYESLGAAPFLRARLRRVWPELVWSGDAATVDHGGITLEVTLQGPPDAIHAVEVRTSGEPDAAFAILAAIAREGGFVTVDLEGRRVLGHLDDGSSGEDRAAAPRPNARLLSIVTTGDEAGGPLGTQEAVRAAISEVFAETDWRGRRGVVESDHALLLFDLGRNPFVEAFRVEGSGPHAEAAITRLCMAHGWAATHEEPTAAPVTLADLAPGIPDEALEALLGPEDAERLRRERAREDDDPFG